MATTNLTTAAGPQHNSSGTTKDDTSKPSDLVDVGWIAVFDEHTGDDDVTYDAELLQQIAANNNHRIEDTDDYCPIVQWHTKDDGSPDDDPPVVGLAGPFKVGRIGKKRPRACIFAKFRIYRDMMDVFRRRPRRSVEIWPEDSPENRYIDPIALLGAETPRRDLGVYQAKKPQQPYRYSLKYAGSGRDQAAYNAGLARRLASGKERPRPPAPPLTKEDKQAIADRSTLDQGQLPIHLRGPQQNAVNAPQPKRPPENNPGIVRGRGRLKGSYPGKGNVFDYGDAQYLVDEEDKVHPLDVPERNQAAAPSATNAFIPGGTPTRKRRHSEDSNMPLTHEDISQLVEGLKPTLEAMIDEKLATMTDVDADPGEEAVDTAMSPGDEDIAGGPPEDDLSPAPPLAADGLSDEGDMPPPPMDGDLEDELDEEDKLYAKHYGKRFYEKYCKDEDAKEHYEKLGQHSQGLLKHYSKEAEGEHKDFYAKLMGEKEADKAVEPVKASHYKKQRDDYKLRYAKLERTHKTLKEKYAKATEELELAKEQVAESRIAEKYSKRREQCVALQSEGFVLDPEEEATDHLELDEDKWTQHIDKIKSRYQKVPIERLDLGQSQPLKYDKDQRSEKYSKAARDYCLKNRGANYQSVLKYMLANDTTSVDASAVS